MSKRNLFLWLFAGAQVLCALVFLSNFIISVFGLRASGLSWQLREGMEIAASLGLLIGAALGIRAVIQADKREAQATEVLRTASGAFAEVVNEKFTNWALTEAERDVAWLAIKGFSTKETAHLRGSSEGTVKAQAAAIYRKTGVTGRTQLISALVEDLLVSPEEPALL